MDVGAGDPAVLDVADDDDFEPRDATLALSDRQGVQQGLGRVLMSTITGVDDGRAQVPRQEVGSACRADADA